MLMCMKSELCAWQIQYILNAEAVKCMSSTESVRHVGV